MPARSQYALFVLAVTFTWLMGLMGFARSGIRQHWHVWEVMRDTSPQASTPALGYAANMISRVRADLPRPRGVHLLARELAERRRRTDAAEPGGAAPSGVTVGRARLAPVRRRAMWRTISAFSARPRRRGFYTTIAHVIPQLQSEVPETLALGSDATPEALASAGEKIFNGAGGCTACHGLGTRAPNLLTDQAGQGPIGARCGTRKPGMDCKAYLYESLEQAQAYVVQGFEPIMPDMSKQFSRTRSGPRWRTSSRRAARSTVRRTIARRRRRRRRPGARPASFTATTDPVTALQREGMCRLPPARWQGRHGRPVVGSPGQPAHGGVDPPEDPRPERATRRRAIEKFAGMMPAKFGTHAHGRAARGAGHLPRRGKK